MKQWSYKNSVYSLTSANQAIILGVVLISIIIGNLFILRGMVIYSFILFIIKNLICESKALGKSGDQLPNQDICFVDC